MAIDRNEATQRGQLSRKASSKHPYVGIEHRVIDSAAFADLKPTAQVLLFLFARQSTKDNNGHLQGTFSYMKRFGIGSEHTLKDSIAQLISHGFLYRTRSHGANGAWARYALTSLPITKKENLFLAGFIPFAWRNWQPPENKSTRKKVPEVSSKNCGLSIESPAESAGILPVKNADYESVLPCSNEILESEKNKRGRCDIFENETKHIEHLVEAGTLPLHIRTDDATKPSSGSSPTLPGHQLLEQDRPSFELTFSH